MGYPSLLASPDMDPFHGSVFQAESVTVLYEKPVWFKVLRADREDVHEELIIRIATDLQKGSHHSKLLKMQITSEDDPFFLHSLEISEEDFQTLKVDQSILVDFGAFPNEIIDLLEACVHAKGEENPQFRAILRLDAGFSTFSVLEVNKFKHLSHISLSFRPGNDAAIKQYLASRLTEVKGHRENLRATLEVTKEQLETTVSSEAQLAKELAEHREQNAVVVGEMRNAQMASLNEAKQKALEELEEATQRYESERSATVARHQEQMKTLETRNSELDAQVRTLMEQKYALDGKVSELSAKCGTATGELAAAKAELEKVRKENTKMDAAAHEREKKHNQQLVHISSLEQQVKDKDEVLATLRERLEGAEKHKAALEEALGESRASAARSEERVAAVSAEIRKGNGIIEKLQADAKAAKAKAKLKAAVITQQEALVGERQATVDKLSRELAAAQLERDGLAEEKRALLGRVEDQKGKLEESHQLLQSNQQMIQWLNQQVNDAQLGGLGVSSRYTFRMTSSPGGAAGRSSPPEAAPPPAALGTTSASKYNYSSLLSSARGDASASSPSPTSVAARLAAYQPRSTLETTPVVPTSA